MMISLAVTALLATSWQAEARIMGQISAYAEHFCSDAVYRLKGEPSADWKTIAGSGQYFIDNSFKYGADVLYWGSYSERGPIERFLEKVVWF
jgi:hypothetical protein